MQVFSDDIARGVEIPLVHAEPKAGGRNLVPQLSWRDIPVGAKSLALTIWDPDAPVDGGFWHWLALDVPVSTSGIPRGGSLPHGTHELPNDYGYEGYGGPCPPHGQRHRYIFTVWALDIEHLLVPDAITPAEVAKLLEEHRIDSATLTPVFTSTL